MIQTKRVYDPPVKADGKLPDQASLTARNQEGKSEKRRMD